MRRPSTVLSALAAAAALAFASAGCGLGPGKSADGVSLRVTRDFGAKTLGEQTIRATHGSVMRMLEANYPVKTRYGGRFVQAIKGLSGGREHGAPVDWFYYVNGVEADQGAAAVSVHSGDRVWWDRHDWGEAMRIPVVVGSFPEPFLHGYGQGQRLPVRVECAVPGNSTCKLVLERLHRAGVENAAPALLGAESGTDILRVLVGPWSKLRDDAAAHQLEHGPRASGVYARPAANGRTIAVLDPAGHVTRTLRGDSGLIAATRYEDSAPVWLVTGTDSAGVHSAASAFDEGDLADHFALAVSHDLAVPVPATPSP